MEYDGEEYGISKLPDEIVISILRRIPMKEAARTSVLSRRWKSLWTLCPRLELDGSKRMFNFLTKVKGMDYCESDYDTERGGFINWVNHVLESCHAAHAIDEFKLRFEIHDKFRHEIDKCVRFAFEKKVKRFELDFSWSLGDVTCDPKSYHLSLQALKIPSSTCITTSLTSLILKQVNTGRSITLLEIRSSIGGDYLPYFARNLPLLSPSNFSHLHKLVLDTSSWSPIAREIEWSEHPILSQLKQLELNVAAFDNDDINLHCCPLIEACTSLNSLALKLMMCVESSTRREVRKPNKRLHQSLRVVEVTGFVGQTADTELCIYLIENAIMLDKIIIDPCYLHFTGTPNEDDYNIELVKQGRECAEQLRSKYCLADKLVIL
ncbi:hypothetical protein CCACVL1_00194 [Corchorus capsularis]|uniref:F-box domain-containing protein n=1 Tax=Corchorus capsularis TaxID=210143 RepID=A0A1R3KXX9_COCAP|nr:hypothetical protein CCACVL1_00194 [Corchorus capsularis]